ncbi:Xaa-Pro aminopeptidase [Thermosynechococcaceae cyanobacterium BACA0444]|uniref:Xaa-Pro aminopeptidase n=1 Tax=Pseudocalidococcus azoricus BACA0444 TaxID=2918990 RepID=A0AAE4FS27_9CYAN|nr:Xaa-Pro aminopeptidase [Pseudocalidococcus azoricus]MDS3861273.1 Xaa-Pro aminopeptidase [Pseudocalidococcus azoricus BACA0444]
MNDFLARRRGLAKNCSHPVLLWAGSRVSRNFAANTYPFRASSHFLYFTGLNLAETVIYLEAGNLILFWDELPESAALWHGDSPTRDQLADQLQAQASYPLAKLAQFTANAATIPLVNPHDRQHQAQILNRPVEFPLVAEDLALAQALIDLRLTQDAAARSEISQAIAVTIRAQQAGMKITQNAKTEAKVRAWMEQVVAAHQFNLAYTSIVTTQGQVLHQEHSPHTLKPGDLLLVDLGAETPGGWAADITRTWPVSGKFSATQREIYEVVLAAQTQAIAAIKPGVEFWEIHRIALQVITEGLFGLGILQGSLRDLLALEIGTTFFPHGIGHLLGLDVHDMEDLGDLAGYGPGRNRSPKPGWRYLRLHRPLQEHMVVTIEPGFYQIPQLLNQARLDPNLGQWINWVVLTKFADVKGIRIEDDVLVTANGAEVLSQGLVKKTDDLESLWL